MADKSDELERALGFDLEINHAMWKGTKKEQELYRVIDGHQYEVRAANRQRDLA